MQKIVIALVAIAALLVAVILLLLRRPAPRTEGRGRLGARFALVVSGLMALLGGSREARAEKPAPTAGDRASSEAALEKRAEWRSLRARFKAVATLARVDHDGLEKTVAAGRAESRKLLQPLVAAKLVSRDAAEVLTELHADRVYHALRKTAATCYRPPQLGAKVQTTRDAREKQLALLASLAAKGTIKPELAAKVRRTVEKQVEVLLRVSALWEKQKHQKSPNWAAIRKEEDAILALFARRKGYGSAEIKDGIKLRPGLEDAMRLCQLLLR
jgi:hypothetical protein